MFGLSAILDLFLSFAEYYTFLNAINMRGYLGCFVNLREVSIQTRRPWCSGNGLIAVLILRQPHVAVETKLLSIVFSRAYQFLRIEDPKKIYPFRYCFFQVQGSVFFCTTSFPKTRERWVSSDAFIPSPCLVLELKTEMFLKLVLARQSLIQHNPCLPFSMSSIQYISSLYFFQTNG